MTKPRYLARPDLRATIYEQGRYQTWVANLINRHKSYLSSVLSGRLTLSAADAQTIATALDASVDDLFRVKTGTSHNEEAPA